MGPLWWLIARRLRRRLPADRVEPVLVDLLDDYSARRQKSGPLRSRVWLLREARSLEVAYRARAGHGHQATDRRPSHLEALSRDIRVGWRSLRRTPALTTATIATLAVGIGANTAIFALVNGVLLQPLPYPDADRIVSIVHRGPGSNADIPSAPYLYFTYRDSAETLERVGLWQRFVATVTGVDRPEQVPVLAVTHEILPLLGVVPHAGRVFSQQDDEPNSALTVLLSWGYWQQRFGGAPAIGQPITVNGSRGTVIGVLPQSFVFLDRPADIVFPMQLDPAQVTLGRYIFPSLARLKPQVTLEHAAADLAVVVPRAVERFPPPPGYTRERFAARPVTPRLVPIKDEMVGGVSQALWILMGALAIVLMIACANVAHLLLVRADARRRELAVRAALGATVARIAGTLVTEGVLLGLIGGAAGIVVAYLALRTVLIVIPAGLPRAQEIGIDPLVIVFAAVISLVCGVWLGLLPVAKLVRRTASGLAAALTDGGRSTSDGRERQRTRSVLVAIQVALSLVLLVCSGLMIRTLQSMTRVEPGFSRPEEVQLVSVADSQPDPDRTLRTQRAIVEALAAIPGVSSVGYSDLAPLDPDNRRNDTVLTIEGSRPVPGSPRPLRRFQFISPGYLRTIDTPIVAGRDLDWADLEERRQVAIVSAALARQEWESSAAAIGKRVQVSPTDPWREVIGVAGDVRDDGMDKPAPPIVYFPVRVDRFWGAPAIAFGSVTLVIRSTRAGADPFVREVEQAVGQVNADLPVARIRRLSDVYRASLARTSFTMTMLLIAGAMGLLLGVIGIYGVVAYGVSQRAREIGIRLALGARPAEVTRLFLRHGVALAVAGGIAGLVAASLTTRLMRSLLVEVTPVDPLTFAVATSVVLSVAIVSAYAAARHAVRRDALDALR